MVRKKSGFNLGGWGVVDKHHPERRFSLVRGAARKVSAVLMSSSFMNYRAGGKALRSQHREDRDEKEKEDNRPPLEIFADLEKEDAAFEERLEGLLRDEHLPPHLRSTPPPAPSTPLAPDAATPADEAAGGDTKDASSAESADTADDEDTTIDINQRPTTADDCFKIVMARPYAEKAAERSKLRKRMERLLAREVKRLDEALEAARKALGGPTAEGEEEDKEIKGEGKGETAKKSDKKQEKKAKEGGSEKKQEKEGVESEGEEKKGEGEEGEMDEVAKADAEAKRDKVQAELDEAREKMGEFQDKSGELEIDTAMHIKDLIEVQANIILDDAKEALVLAKQGGSGGGGGSTVEEAKARLKQAKHEHKGACLRGHFNVERVTDAEHKRSARRKKQSKKEAAMAAKRRKLRQQYRDFSTYSGSLWGWQDDVNGCLLSCFCPCVVNALNASLSLEGVRLPESGPAFARKRDWLAAAKMCLLYLVAPCCVGAATRYIIHHATTAANKKAVNDMRREEDTMYCAHCYCPCLAVAQDRRACYLAQLAPDHLIFSDEEERRRRRAKMAEQQGLQAATEKTAGTPATTIEPLPAPEEKEMKR
eukprot:g774.t1